MIYMEQIKIDPEFRDLISKLSLDEFELLEELVVRDGCLDPLKVWNGVLLDGHNRYAICLKHGIEFKVTSVEGVASREDAINWIIDNQLGRRNITDSKKAYLRGKRYLTERHTHGGDRKSSGNSCHLISSPESGGKTRTRIAELVGVSERTIENDAQFAAAIDEIRKVDAEFVERVLSEEVDLSKKDIIVIGTLSGSEQKNLIELINTAPGNDKAIGRLVGSGKVREDEISNMTQVIRTSPEMTSFIIKLRSNGENLEDIEGSVDYVKSLPNDEQKKLIDAGLPLDAVLDVTRTLTTVRKEEPVAKRNASRAVAVTSFKGLTKQDHKVLIGDFRLLSRDIPDDSVDMIFTDPPYDEKSVPLYEEMAIMVARVLKPGSSLISYCSQYALDKILLLMGQHLRFWWVLAVKHGGGYSGLTRKTYECWKPMVWFVKEHNGSDEFVLDLVESVPATKAEHDGQQSSMEAEYYIDKLTVPGGTVLDPFCGSGTICIAAMKLGRKSIAFEIDEPTAKKAMKRIEKQLTPNNG